uniref:Uncharacterized protein n=1 Tax=Romanomermis culicivorax TaxID=13658 RepID=A0A915K5Q7_ROMCU
MRIISVFARFIDKSDVASMAKNKRRSFSFGSLPVGIKEPLTEMPHSACKSMFYKLSILPRTSCKIEQDYNSDQQKNSVESPQKSCVMINI